MNRYFLLLAALIYFNAVSAQTTPGKSFSQAECISYALQNNYTLQNATLDERMADAKVKETRGIGLPQIDGKVGINHNQKMNRFFATKETAYGFSGGEIPYDEFLPGLEGSDVVASPNFFQLPSSGDASLSINQILFNSSYLVGLQAANAYRDLAIKQGDQSREEVIQKVSQAYYAVIINKDRIILFESNIARVDSLLNNTTKLFENGFAESIDVDRTKVTLNNLKVERNKFLRLQDLALQVLKFQMNYPINEPINVAGDISELTIDESVLDEYSANWDYAQRSDYRLLQANQELQTLNLKNKYAEGLPSLVAFANLGYSTQSTNIGGVFKTNSNISDNGMVGPDKWYSYSMFGLSLNVPIFSGLQRTYRVQQAKLELQKTDNNFKSLKSGIDLETKQTASLYLNAVETAASQKENADLAANIARVTKIKFEQGIGSNLEVVEAESDLREAQINYYNALYDALVAKIDLDKAYGKLVTPTPID